VRVTVSMYLWWPCSGMAGLQSQRHSYRVPMLTHRAVPVWSVNEYQWNLGSKWAYHVMH